MSQPYSIPTNPINFICPECDCRTLVVVQTVQETQEVVSVDVYNDNSWLVNGEVLQTEIEQILAYECPVCGFEIGKNNIAALQWLQRHRMIDFSPTRKEL